MAVLNAAIAAAVAVGAVLAVGSTGEGAMYFASNGMTESTV